MASNREGMKRYTLILPMVLYDEVREVAEARHTTVVDVLRRFIKLGLLSVQIEEQLDSALIIRQGDSEKEIVLF